MRLLAVALLALVGATAASAHEGGEHVGFVSTVSRIEPPQLGLLATVLGGHERLSLRNLTRKTVVIFDDAGAPALRLEPGESGSITDPRIGSPGPPPEQGEFVRNWQIHGEAGGEPFRIRGFLGYRPPPGEAGRSDGDGLPTWAWATAGAAGALVLAAALALPLRRREGES